ncbi:uncharacterized protein LOC114122030 isoform X2 [Aphis gossypii]|uniref:uncharacterized protein LOC114122030 isoform X2 n=1 Tax=Aphis gossypii TaxID=80765 RepID=UPI002159437E|nr:uncharacterized protein LOC114122030 isoform X2 [Aphis gossypii]
MESEQKLQTLIHMAIDIKNKQINQHYLVRLLEIIIKNSPQLANCDVDLTQNDEKHSQSVINKGTHEVPTNPLNATFDVSYLDHENTYEYENEELLYKYENEEKSPLNPKNKEVDVSTNPLISDTLNLSYIDKEGMLLEYENEEKSPLNPKNKEVDVSTNPLISDTLNLSYIDKEGMLLEYENEEKRSLMLENKLEEFSNSELTLDKKPLIEKSGSCIYEWAGNLDAQQNVALLRLNTSLRTDRFMTQEWVCLNLGMSAENFRDFDLDYRTNFKNIFNFLELQRSVNRKTKIDIQQLKKKCVRIQKYIKKYIDMDPEAKGVVEFIKGACISCGRSAKMIKTKHPSLSCSGHKKQLLPAKPIQENEIHQLSGKTIKNKPIQTTTNNQCTKPATIPTETSFWINGVPQSCDPFSDKRTGNIDIDLDRIRKDVNSRKTKNDKLNSNNPREKPDMKPSIKICGFIRNSLGKRITNPSLISSTYDDSSFSCCLKGHQKKYNYATKSKRRPIWKF